MNDLSHVAQGGGGGFVWYGGGTGGYIDADFVYFSSNDGPTCIRDSETEQSRRFFVWPRSHAATQAQNLISIENIRMSTGGAVNKFSGSVNTEFMEFGSTGRVDVRQCNIGESGSTNPVAIYYGGDVGFPTFAGTSNFVLDNCEINTSLNLFSVFTNIWPTDMRSSRYNTASGATIVPLANRVPYATHNLGIAAISSGTGSPGSGQNLSGIVTVDWSAQRTVFAELGGDTTFVFHKQPEGLGDCFYMILMGRYGIATVPPKITWPSDVIWTTPQPFLRVDSPAIFNPTIVEFRNSTDSSNIWTGDITVARVLTANHGSNMITPSAGLNSNIARHQAESIVFSSTADFIVGGFDAPLDYSTNGYADGQRLVIHNLYSAQMTIRHLDGSSSPANQIHTLAGADIVLPPGKSGAVLRYSQILANWLVESVWPTPAPTAESLTITSGATTTLTAAQYAIQMQEVARVTLGGTGTVIALPNNRGLWYFDLSAVSFGVNALTFTSGSATSAAVSAPGLYLVKTTGSNGVLVK